MPDVDSILLKIGQLKYLVVTDLTRASYKVHLSNDSLRYIGVVTSFFGVRVYTRCVMGMPGSVR